MTKVPSWARTVALLTLSAGAAGCDVSGRYALIAQETLPPDPEVVMRRLVNLRELDAGGDAVSDPLPLPGGRSVVLTRWTSNVGNFGNLAALDLETGVLRQITADSADYRYSLASGVSRDGKWITFWKDSGAPDWNYDVRVIRSDGTGERSLLRMCCGEDIPLKWAEGRDFTPDGSALLVVAWSRDNTTHLARVSLTDGSTEVVRAFDWRQPNTVQYSPDGRWIAYDFPPEADSRARDLYLLTSDGSREVRLTENSGAHTLLGWARDGSGLYYLTVSPAGAWSLWRLPVREGRTTGAASLIRRDLQHVRPQMYLATQDVGVFLEVQSPTQSIWTAPIDLEAGRLLGAPSMGPTGKADGGGGRAITWSPDGQSLMYARRPLSGVGWELVIQSQVSGEERAIPLPLDRVGSQTNWDEKTVLVQGLSRGRHTWVSVDVAAGQARRVEDPKLLGLLAGMEENNQASMIRPRISLDGSVKYFSRTEGEIGEIVAQQVDSGEERILYRGKGVSQPYISPDRTQLAFTVANDGIAGTGALWVVPTVGGDPRPVFTSTDGVVGPNSVTWSPDSHTLLFLQNKGGSRIWKVGVDGSNPMVVYENATGMSETRLSPDGRRLAFVSRVEGDPVHELWLLDNLPEQRAARTSTPR